MMDFVSLVHLIIADNSSRIVLTTVGDSVHRYCASTVISIKFLSRSTQHEIVKKNCRS